ncbi:DUF2218 domain-containing protein [Nocardia gipuzkoensis]|uniref:DUF2218 domain-containing protein n=1 Tax=Nocardia gipuzkoensis TaxID=2749991 RepID=UPI003EE1DE61
MLTAEACIPTDRASRYLVQLCRHAAAIGGGAQHGRPAGPPSRRDVHVRAEWSSTDGTVIFEPWGRCTLTADEQMLRVRAEAADAGNLREIQSVVTGNLDRFSHREPLRVEWTATENSDEPIAEYSTEYQHAGPSRRWSMPSWRTLALGVFALLAVVAHLVVGGSLMANLLWTGVIGTAILLGLKITLVVLGGRGLHRRITARPHGPGH